MLKRFGLGIRYSPNKYILYLKQLKNCFNGRVQKPCKLPIKLNYIVFWVFIRIYIIFTGKMTSTQYTQIFICKHHIQKSHIQETLNLSTNADSSTDSFFPFTLPKGLKYIFARPKKGRPRTGFSIFIRSYVRPYVRTFVRPSVSEIKFWSLRIH